MGWKHGPLPKDTYGWGGIVPLDLVGHGFYFAYFQGDKVVAITADQSAKKEFRADQVRYYNNDLGLPPEYGGESGKTVGGEPNC